MQRPANPRRLPRRLLAATAVALLHAALLALLLLPTRIPLPATESALITVNIPNPPPPAPPAPIPAPPEPAAKSAPPAPRARPKPVITPPTIQPETPAAPTTAEGPDTSSGAAAAGPGTGASGPGAGTGAGGPGSGGGSTRAHRIAGDITRRDYPSAARGAQGSVTTTLEISPEGRVSACRITRSSGNATLDKTTCALIQKRFRYAPARDSYGNAIPGLAGYRQDWWLEPRALPQNPPPS